MNSTDARPRMAVPWTLRDAAKAVALVAGVAALLAFVAALALLVSGGTIPGSRILFSAVLEGMLLVAVWRFGPWRYGQSWRALGLSTTLSSGALLALMVLLASLAFVLLYTAAMKVLGLASLTPPPIPDELMKTYPERIAAFVLIVVVAPVAEESFFRGFLLPVLADRWGFWVGASFVSVLFAMAHLAPGVLLPAFVSGLLLAWLYRRTGSLWNCCLAHAAQNALAFAVAISV
ncbi:MAG: CPBP family intramembrane glutamic endopeptidase [Chloroflexota bacterium]